MIIIAYPDSFRTDKLKLHENVCKNHDYCEREMPEIGNNILKYNHWEKSLKVPFVIYPDTESLFKVENILPPVIHYLYIVHLVAIKINMIIIEVKIA